MADVISLILAAPKAVDVAKKIGELLQLVASVAQDLLSPTADRVRRHRRVTRRLSSVTLDKPITCDMRHV
jgi:hypothetical protein